MTKTIRLSDAIEVVQDNLAFSVKADIIKALSALPAVEGWLPIESAPRGKQILLIDASGAMCVDEVRTHNRWMKLLDGEGPTHWQPLPAPPIE